MVFPGFSQCEYPEANVGRLKLAHWNTQCFELELLAIALVFEDFELLAGVTGRLPPGSATLHSHCDLQWG